MTKPSSADKQMRHGTTLSLGFLCTYPGKVLSKQVSFILVLKMIK